MSLLQDFHHYTRDDPDDIYRHNSHVPLDTLNVLVSTKLISQIPLELSTYIIVLGFAHIHACQWAFKMIIRPAKRELELSDVAVYSSAIVIAIGIPSIR